MANDYIDKGLRALTKACNEPPHARVGILVGKSAMARKVPAGGKSGPTNAEIGAAHEYGAPARHLSQRSFLRMPINDFLDAEISRAPGLAKTAFEKAVKKGTLFDFLDLLGAAGERVVRLAFTNNGFGKWAPLSQARVNEKTVNNILVETTQLRESIQYEVVK